MNARQPIFRNPDDQTLLLAWSGETFLLSSAPIWVQPVAVALSVAQGGV